MYIFFGDGRLENTPAKTHARANSFLEGSEASVKRLPKDKGNDGQDIFKWYKWTL